MCSSQLDRSGYRQNLQDIIIFPKPILAGHSLEPAQRYIIGVNRARVPIAALFPRAALHYTAEKTVHRARSKVRGSSGMGLTGSLHSYYTLVKHGSPSYTHTHT